MGGTDGKSLQSYPPSYIHQDWERCGLSELQVPVFNSSCRANWIQGSPWGCGNCPKTVGSKARSVRSWGASPAPECCWEQVSLKLSFLMAGSHGRRRTPQWQWLQILHDQQGAQSSRGGRLPEESSCQAATQEERCQRRLSCSPPPVSDDMR